MAYDEMKTVMLDREETIRSRTAKGVEQEIWGILLASNLVRLEMERTADRHDVAPTQISFVTSMRIIRLAAHASAASVRVRRRLVRRRSGPRARSLRP